MKKILLILVPILALGGCGKQKVEIPVEVKGMKYYEAHPEEIKPEIQKCRDMKKRGEELETNCINARAAASNLILDGKLGKKLKQPGVTLTDENQRLREELQKENQRLREEYSY